MGTREVIVSPLSRINTYYAGKIGIGLLLTSPSSYEEGVYIAFDAGNA